MGPVSQRSTLGLSGRAACPQALDQLTCLTAKSADDRASPLPATWKRPSQSKPATLPAEQGQETALWRRILRLPLADSRAEMTFPAPHSPHPACLPPSLLVSAIVARPPHKPHCWLTNRINIPTAINRASRIPTTNERTGCRLAEGFDPAPFCAAPRPNQKRRLPID